MGRFLNKNKNFFFLTIPNEKEKHCVLPPIPHIP